MSDKELDKLNPRALLAMIDALTPIREPQPRGAYKSTLTKVEQKKRAKKNKAQKAARKRNK